MTVDRSGRSRRPGFGSSTMDKWVQDIVEQGFSSFFAKFLAYLMIYQSGKALQNFEK